ncbi:MAG: DUF4964 domain-containing protein, partial [Bacteroidales bacterium]|nr:DUF4964 domain-containing protein [Bacteroidales bacterium]
MRTINILLCAAIAILSACNTPTETTNQNEGIRPPAIPLITIDPYTSCWVFGDQLNNQTIYHWTGHVYPMNGYIKVDNETYRFMGGPEYEDYLPISQKKSYTLQYTNTKPNDGWMMPEYNTSDWNEGTSIVGWDTTRAEINSHCTKGPLYVRRTFNWKESDTRDLAVLANHGGNTCQHMEFYINGVLAASIAQARKKRTYPLSTEAKKALVEGENVLAV